ncbi:hypothetical protein BCON_0010g00280 [Botryotinia convoluta]|uniref:F-box domain-containing protein n=1 Tax=Botryotinia convoluta TaxID=54673 RepID=A0A4Z1J472_9HELO|nr:hypothetical protein BCON_0010g00280 [Botryotinia convoluta]
MPRTLDGLPEEVIIGIGLCLPRDSLVMLAQCSNHFYAACIELLYSHCTVRNRTNLEQLINTILNGSVIGASIRWLDLRQIDWNEFCISGRLETTSLFLFKKAVLVQNNLASWNISTWTNASWRDISCWTLITVLLCLVPELRVLALPALEPERHNHGYFSRGSHYDVSIFSDFIARLAKDQQTESPDHAPLRVLANLESITIGTEFYNREAELHFIMPLRILRSVKRFKVCSMCYHGRLGSPRVICATPIPNIESLNFLSCTFTGDIATFLGRFTGIQRFYLSQVPRITYKKLSKMPLSVENILEGLTSSKHSLEYVDVSFASRIPDGQSLSLSEFKRLQVVKLWPSPSIWSSGSPIEDNSRLINSLPPGLRILVCKPFFDEHDVVSLEQLYKLVAEKEKYVPELRQIELIWDDASLTYKCADCENHCELNEKIPFFTKLIAECKAKNICILSGHPLWKLAAPQSRET